MMVDKHIPTNDLHLPTGQHRGSEAKAFATLRALLAMAGHALSRSDAGDGERTYFVARWGMVRELRTLDDVHRFALQVRGGQ